jgi:large subunit ribosomal protein L24
LSGKESGNQGKVLRVDQTKQRAVVENLNFIKRHTRPNPQKNIRGGVVQREGTIHLSNLQVVCPDCSTATRVSFVSLADGRKVRQCKKCKAMLDK